MRIVIDGRYASDGFPGIGRYVFNLARGLAQLGGDDELVFLHNPELSNTRFDLATLDRPPRSRTVPCLVPRWLPAEVVRLPGIVRRLEAHVFHSPFFVRPYRLGCPAVVTIHDVIPLARTMDWRDRTVFRLAGSVACRTSAAIITASHAAALDLQRWQPSVGSRLHVTPLAPDPDLGAPEPAAVAALRSRLELADRYVLHLGSHLRHKGVDRLIEAWALRRAGPVDPPSEVLALAGPEGPETPRLRAMVRARGLESSVRFLGPVAERDLSALYGGAVVFALPSTHEGFGLPVLEAMACGTPVVASAVGSVTEVAGDAAVLVDPASTTALALALDRLLSEPEARAALAVRGRARAAAHSWRATAEATRRIYAEVAGG